ncbi:MAG: CvpA family protein [Deltaproteobacteria bacterium]|nr:CvpA family protein [Deltaproteobacteria bacterium]
MNPLDLGIVALCVVLALFGLMRGFVRQAASLTGLVLGHILAVKYNGWAQKLLRLDFPHAGIVAYLIALLAVYIAVRLIGLLVERWVRASKLSGTDRFLGGLAGAVKGSLVSVLLVFVLVVLLPRDASLLKSSKLAPHALVAAGWLEKTFPERIRESFREKIGPGEARPPEKGGRSGTESVPADQSKKRSRK